MPESVNELLPSERARFEEVCRFGQDNLEPVATTLALAFAEDPVWQWIHDTDGPVPLESSIVLARMLTARMAPIDEVLGFRHFGAVALWSAPEDAANDDGQAAVRDAQSAPFLEAFRAQMGERIALTGEFGEVMHAHRPEEPHWYLGMLGTHPERQSQGLGGQVLQAMHHRCDLLGLPCYLESSNPRNYGFYQRHGYVETVEMSAAGSPKLLGFWRAPR